MKEFVLLFRMDITTKEAQPSPQQMQEYMIQWMDWINMISKLGQLANGGNHMSPTGKVIKHGNTVTDGPYTVNEESVAGYIIIRASDIDDAMLIAKQCPILNGPGNSVEIRQTATPGSM